MKRLSLLFLCSAVLLFASCKQSADESKERTTVEEVSVTSVVPASADKSAAPVTKEVFETVAAEAIKNELMEFVKSDLLEYYLEVNEYSKDVVNSIKALVDIAGNDGPFLYYLLMYSFSKEKKLKMEDNMISNIDELSNAVVELGVQKVLSKEYQPQLYAWLYCMGYGQEVNMMRKRDNNE